MKLSEEISIALLYVIWHLNIMDLSHMISYISITIKALVTCNLVTSKPLLGKMPMLVLDLVALGCEATVAVIAFERFVARVDPLMKQ